MRCIQPASRDRLTQALSAFARPPSSVGALLVSNPFVFIDHLFWRKGWDSAFLNALHSAGQ
ncbi:MAG: hypothetical protein VW378_06305, partial [bacterium]